MLYMRDEIGSRTPKSATARRCLQSINIDTYMVKSFKLKVLQEFFDTKKMKRAVIIPRADHLC